MEKRSANKDRVVVETNVMQKTISTDQATEMLTTQALKVKRAKKRMEMIATLYSKISDHENDSEFLRRLREEDYEALKVALGPMFSFNTRNVTGHFKLDLEDPWHNVIACKLAELSVTEKKRQLSLDMKDLSQKGNRQCWRNELYNGEPFVYNPMKFIIPNQGILELDFASFVRPPSKATPITQERFAYVLQLVQQAIDECVEDDEAALIYLRKNSLTFYLDCAQMQQIFASFDEKADQIEAFVILWPRLVDEENSHEMLKHFSNESAQILRNRLGHLALFNPMQPDGKYELDLAVHDQAAVAKLLLLLSVRESGRNLQHETFNGHRLEIPKEWLAELPKDGLLNMHYVTERPEFALADLRRSLSEQVLGWSFADE